MADFYDKRGRWHPNAASAAAEDRRYANEELEISRNTERHTREAAESARQQAAAAMQHLEVSEELAEAQREQTELMARAAAHQSSIAQQKLEVERRRARSQARHEEDMRELEEERTRTNEDLARFQRDVTFLQAEDPRFRPDYIIDRATEDLAESLRNSEIPLGQIEWLAEQYAALANAEISAGDAAGEIRRLNDRIEELKEDIAIESSRKAAKAKAQARTPQPLTPKLPASDGMQSTVLRWVSIFVFWISILLLISAGSPRNEGDMDNPMRGSMGMMMLIPAIIGMLVWRPKSRSSAGVVVDRQMKIRRLAKIGSNVSLFAFLVIGMCSPRGAVAPVVAAWLCFALFIACLVTVLRTPRMPRVETPAAPPPTPKTTIQEVTQGPTIEQMDEEVTAAMKRIDEIEAAARVATESHLAQREITWPEAISPVALIRERIEEFQEALPRVYRVDPSSFTTSTRPKLIELWGVAARKAQTDISVHVRFNQKVVRFTSACR